ncbi:MAG: dihydrofolate reductase family protein, partial [Mycobacteriales bacterium]
DGLFPEHVDVLTVGPDNPDDLLAALYARGLRRVLCEGGPQLFETLLGAGLVDELCLTVAPQLVGSGPRLLDGPAAVQMELASMAEDEGVLLTRWTVLAPS